MVWLVKVWKEGKVKEVGFVEDVVSLVRKNLRGCKVVWVLYEGKMRKYVRGKEGWSNKLVKGWNDERLIGWLDWMLKNKEVYCVDLFKDRFGRVGMRIVRR